MDRLENVATPLTAATVVVPDSVPPPGFVPTATVMLAVQLVTMFFPSSTLFRSAGEMATPATSSVGWAVNASLAAAAGLMLNADEVAEVSGADAAVRV